MKKAHRFIGKFEINAERLLLRDTALIHQIRTVLKLHVNEQIILADGSGTEALVGITSLSVSGIDVTVIERRPSAEPKRQVILYCAVLKRENFELVAQKAVECGVNKIVRLLLRER